MFWDPAWEPKAIGADMTSSAWQLVLETWKDCLLAVRHKDATDDVTRFCIAAAEIISTK